MSSRNVLLSVLVLAVVGPRGATAPAAAMAAPPKLTALPTAPSVKAQRLARELDAYVRPLLAQDHLSGQLLVTQHGRTVLERSYGMANRELGVPVTPESRFCVASITKPMTLILALQLIEEKKLGYLDTLDKWIPDFPDGDKITIEHLLRHRSGIPHRVTTRKDETQPMSAAELVEIAKKAVLEFEPGSKSTYSSGGYSVLARVLELASGKTYADLIEERVFKPAGMTHSSGADGRQILSGRAPSYVHSVDGLTNAPFEDVSFLVGAGSVFSTARDLNLLIQAVASGKFGESVRQSVMRGAKIDWNGSTNGYRAFADYDSVSGVAVIFAGNLHTGAPDLVRKAVAEIIAGRTPERVRIPDLRAVALPMATLRGFEGVYRLMTSGLDLKLRAGNGMMTVNDWLLIPIAKDTFFSLRDYGEVKVVTGGAGKPERLDWKVSGQVYACPRMRDLTPVEASASIAE